MGPETGDDAAVWRIAPDRALVVTADFITPVVDDPRTWGRIAATNAASDIYAMGGRPILALNLVGWNTEELGLDMLSEVLAGAAETARAGAWVSVGGHSVEDPEPKFGLAVVGEVHPDRILTNAGLQVGEHLVLTKALGVGILTTAIKKEGGLPPEVYEAVVGSMGRLNDLASQAALAAGARGATDVTGFGLLGHLRRMIEASGVGAEIFPDSVPILPMAESQARANRVPSGSVDNLKWASEVLQAGDSPRYVQLLLADAQTSGGLLFGAQAGHARAAVDALLASGHQAAVVGRVTDEVGTIRLSHGQIE